MDHAAPTSETTRIRSLDLLRGVAVLGIFVMNSRNFGLPLQQFDNPAFPGRPGSPAKAADLWAWAIGNLAFEDKMIAIFSMLFGAGIVLNADRIAAAASRLRAASIHYRRMFWLLIIGLIHAYGLWYGDILNTYAICGALLYPLHRLRPGLLVGIGILVITISIWARVGPRMYETVVPRDSASAQVDTPRPPESTQDRIWRESTENEDKAYRGSYIDLFRWRANLNTVWHFYGGRGAH